MSLDKSKLIAETIREYLLCASIIAAAIWAFYTFFITEKSNIYSKPIIEARMKVTQILSRDGKYLKSVVTLTNKGNDPVWIELKSPSLSLRSVEINNEEHKFKLLSKQFYQGYLDNLMMSYGQIKELELSEKSKVELAYISKHENKGLPTQITFMATYKHKQLRSQLADRGYSNLQVFTVQANEYVYFN